MAIVFKKEERKQKYLILVFIMVIGLTLTVLFSNKIFKKRIVSPLQVYKSPPEIEINWNLLQDSRLEKLQLPEKIFPIQPTEYIEEKIGRENPFAPY